MSCFGEASLRVCGCHDTATALTRRVDGVEASRPRRRRRGDRSKFKFHEDAASDMDTGKSFCASPGTGMGTGASRNAAPADASLPTSMTNNFAGWPSFFSWKQRTWALSERPGTLIV